jgi:hypothetical protein
MALDSRLRAASAYAERPFFFFGFCPEEKRGAYVFTGNGEATVVHRAKKAPARVTADERRGAR